MKKTVIILITGLSLFSGIQAMFRRTAGSWQSMALNAAKKRQNMVQPLKPNYLTLNPGLFRQKAANFCNKTFTQAREKVISAFPPTQLTPKQLSEQAFTQKTRLTLFKNLPLFGVILLLTSEGVYTLGTHYKSR